MKDDIRNTIGERSSADREGPGLVLILGPPNSGKMGLLLDWWRKRLAARPLLVAPTMPVAGDLSREMLRRAGGLADSSGAVTFQQFVELLSGCRPRYLTPALRMAIAGRVMSSEPLTSLGPATGFAGASRRLAELLAELEEGGRLEESAELLGRWGAAFPQSASVASELERIVRRYRQALDNLGLVTREEATRQALQHAGEWTRPVGLYGFTSLTEAQRALVENLSRRVEVLLVLPHDRTKSVELSPPSEIAWWQERAAAVVERPRQPRAYSDPALSCLEEHLFGYKQRPAPVSSQDQVAGVTFLMSSGRRAEAEAAAQKIAELLRQGFSPGDIAVLVREVGEWSSLLKQVFDSCAIPWHIDERVTARDTGLGWAFLAALRAVLEDDPECMLAYLRTPYSGVPLEAVADLETTYRRTGRPGLEALTQQAAVGGVPEVSRSLEMVRCLVPSSDGSPEKSLGGMLSRLDMAGARNLLREMLRSGLSGMGVAQREPLEDASAYRTLDDLLAELEWAGPLLDDMRFAPLSARDLADIVGQAFLPGTGGESEDAVQVLSVQRARARRFFAVVVLGLAEGEFPRPPMRASLLGPRQRKELALLGGERFLQVSEARDEALFLTAISRAWQVLVLSGRNSDDDGSACEISRFWSEAKELLAVPDEEVVRRGLGDRVFSPESAPSVRQYLRACFARRPGLVSDSSSAPGRSLSAKVGRPDRLREVRVLKELEEAECFTPSELETYLQCPFRWFIERIVGAQTLDRALDGRLVGELLHIVLSRAYRRMEQQGLLPLSPEKSMAAEAVIDEVVAEVSEEELVVGTCGARRVIFAWLKGLAHRAVRVEAAAAKDLDLVATEYSVGGEAGVPIDGFRIRGRIDRIDAERDGEALFVLDYKSGAVPGSSKLGTAEALQLPLYLKALAAERPGRTVMGGAYLSVSEGTYSGIVLSAHREMVKAEQTGLRVMDQDEWQGLLDQAVQQAEEAVRGIRSGVIAPQEGGECPSWCELGPLCRSRRKERWRA